MRWPTWRLTRWPADMVVKIPNEDFTRVILTIGDTFGDDVGGGAGGDGHGGSGR